MSETTKSRPVLDGGGKSTQSLFVSEPGAVSLSWLRDLLLRNCRLPVLLNQGLNILIYTYVAPLRKYSQLASLFLLNNQAVTCLRYFPLQFYRQGSSGFFARASNWQRSSLAGVTWLAKRLDVADIIASSFREGNDVICREKCGLSALNTCIIVLRAKSEPFLKSEGTRCAIPGCSQSGLIDNALVSVSIPNVHVSSLFFRGLPLPVPASHCLNVSDSSSMSHVLPDWYAASPKTARFAAFSTVERSIDRSTEISLMVLCIGLFDRRFFQSLYHSFGTFLLYSAIAEKSSFLPTNFVTLQKLIQEALCSPR